MKFCNIVSTYALANRMPAARLRFFALDPGLMPGTGLARDNSAFNRFMWRSLLRWIAPNLPGASTAERSGAALAWLLTSPDPAIAKDLVEGSLELCGIPYLRVA